MACLIRSLSASDGVSHQVLDFDGSYGLGVLTDGYFPMNPFIGGWVLLAIVAASMSTGDGAILAMSTVWSHNLCRKLPVRRAACRRLMPSTCPPTCPFRGPVTAPSARYDAECPLRRRVPVTALSVRKEYL